MCNNDALGNPDANVEVQVAASPFSMGDRVIHEVLGKGAVQRVSDGNITVLFDKAGYKTLALDLLLGQALLEKAE